MRPETKDALQLFVEKAGWLAGLNYVQWLQANRGKALQIGGEQEGDITIQHTRPTDNDTDALLLTFRMFIQQRDRCSFEWLAKHALDDPGLSTAWNQGFTRMHGEVNAWLDRPSGLFDTTYEYVVEGENVRVTAVHEHPLAMREIMDVFIYGNAAHVNPDKKSTFDRWKVRPIWFPMAKMEFDLTLIGILPGIWNVARLSEHELANQASPTI
jgi:hypothetical protein